MKKIKTKVTPPMRVKDFAADILDFAKEDATKEEIDYLKSEVKDMIETLEAWKANEKVTITTK